MASQAPTLRSLYRRVLRELPARSLANPSPLQSHIRSDFATSTSPSTSSPSIPESLSHQLSTKSAEGRMQEAEQYIQYLKSQRIYATLIERYNPGMNMSEEDRVQKTARRVGMDLPDEWIPGSEGGKGGT